MKQIELTEMILEMRDKDSISDAEAEACAKVWYNRCHLVVKDEIKNGQIKIVKKWKKGYSTQNFVTEEGWKLGQKAAKRIEKKYGKKNLIIHSDFDWGMLNGRLETLRWVMGEDWGILDT
jgi:hypothetical protein